MRTILDTLTREHDEPRALLDQLDATSDDAEGARTRLLQRMEATLVPHAKWEELVFYTAFADRASHEQLAMQAEAMREHRAVEQSVLPDLHAADVGSREFAGSAMALHHMLEHHAPEEGNRIFAAMREPYTPQELAELDDRYEEWKESGESTAAMMHAKAKTAMKAMFRSPRMPG